MTVENNNYLLKYTNNNQLPIIKTTIDIKSSPSNMKIFHGRRSSQNITGCQNRKSNYEGQNRKPNCQGQK